MARHFACAALAWLAVDRLDVPFKQSREKGATASEESGRPQALA
jgi:hypothetical protein